MLTKYPLYYHSFGAPMATRNKQASSVLVTKTVSESSFSSGVDGWVPSGSATLINVYGNVRAITTAINSGMKKVFSTEPGKTYRIKFKINLRGWPYLYVKDLATTNTIFSVTDFLSPNNYAYTITATGYQTQVEFLEVDKAVSELQLASFTLEEVEAENGYRFGFNGKEKDNETYGEGNSYDFGSRSIYDGRLARFKSVDPRYRDFPFMSSYCFAANTPIRFVDVDGEGPGDRIKAGRAFKGTKYKQESGNNRTAASEAALKYMDCSEFVCRVLAADKLTEGVKSMDTESLIEHVEDENSNWEEVKTPVPGDIILWNGHAALVISYNEKTQKVHVIHATLYGNVSSVVEEDYGKKYYKGKKAKFYRPIDDTPDGDLNTTNTDKTSLESTSTPIAKKAKGTSNIATTESLFFKIFHHVAGFPLFKSSNTQMTGNNTTSNSSPKMNIKFTPQETSDVTETPSELKE